MEKLKLCKRCGVEKPLSEMMKRRSSKDGIGSYCKACHRQYHEVKDYSPKKCNYCGAEFKPLQKTELYCTAECRDAKNNESELIRYHNNPKTRAGVKASRLKYVRKACSELRDIYIKGIIRNAGVDPNRFPDMIAEKRENIKLKRTINEKQRQINASGNHG